MRIKLIQVIQNWHCYRYFTSTLSISMFFSDFIACISLRRKFKMNLVYTYSNEPAFLLQNCKNESSFDRIFVDRDFDDRFRQNAVDPCDKSSGAGASVTIYCLRHKLYPIIRILFIASTPSFIRHVFWM